MMNETEEMRQARFDLQMLSASDPAASANMLRHVAATSIMLTGRRGRERREAEPQFAAGFVLTNGDHKLYAAAARQNRIDLVYIAFDVDDATASPIATGVFRAQDSDVFLCGDSRLWSPSNYGRAILVPMGTGEYVGYFTFRPGQPLRLVTAPVPGDLDAGFRRARARMDEDRRAKRTPVAG